jgi:hypothetical protein
MNEIRVSGMAVLIPYVPKEYGDAIRYAVGAANRGVVLDNDLALSLLQHLNNERAEPDAEYLRRVRVVDVYAGATASTHCVVYVNHLQWECLPHVAEWLATETSTSFVVKAADFPTDLFTGQEELPHCVVGVAHPNKEMQYFPLGDVDCENLTKGFHEAWPKRTEEWLRSVACDAQEYGPLMGESVGAAVEVLLAYLLQIPKQAKQERTAVLHIDIRGCARCGVNHDRVPVYALSTPIYRREHFATCPHLKEPILVTVEQEKP